MNTRKQDHSMRNNSLIAAAGVAALAGAAYYFRNELLGLIGYQKVHVTSHVKAKLPIAKNLPTVPDADGNYDLDGVSFDSEGVVVGSDHRVNDELDPLSPH